ncbi:anti-sigma factor antagonist [Rubrobacter indicoceani]|uniref:anti-sigma factor antagonist n=1 Tax=Rubrobacter indicoceani TaxID=2051957 RepID=UPI000E5A5A90|nr:anti-sigma factor antagonist [Rubrobacter indicoceani]
MDFDVSIDEHAEEYSIVTVRGEVDLHTAPKVQYAIERAQENGGGKVVVVDMGGIDFMDSTALSMFARCKDTLEKRGASLRFASPSRAVERIFSVTGFRDYFDIYLDRQAAIS